MATPPKRTPRLMTVTGKTWVTPHMIRVTYAADFIRTLPNGIAGAHCKLYLPQPDQTTESFAKQLEDGPRPDVRTYTIRHIRPDAGEMDIDFVDHGDAGPASAFARRCQAGDVNGFAGPGPIKLKAFYADHYVVAADMSALPVAAATLEAMPKDARGVAFFEVTSEDDKQDIAAPAGIDIQWLIHPEPHVPSTQSLAKIKNLPSFDGTVQTCIAGESGMIKDIRQEIMINRKIPKQDAYISGYWKIGLIEDQHQEFKRSNASAS